MDWLLGSWERLNSSADQQTFEHWQKGPNNTYLGFGYTLQNQDTVFKENMKLLQIEKQWKLEVTGVHEQAVYFTFTKQSIDGFTCENPANEFPKIISYKLKEGKLMAEISGGADKIDFNFKKINK